MAFWGEKKLDPRRQALKEWHGVDKEGLEKNRKTLIRSIEQLMPKVLTDLNLDRRRDDTEVFKAWNHLMDPKLSAHAQPAGLNKGTLFVNVDSSVWLNEIVRYRRREILDRLQNTFGKDRVTKISFRVMG